MFISFKRHTNSYAFTCAVLRFAALAVLLCGGISILSASQINFNSTASLTTEINRTSVGEPWDENYLMDLGVFDAGFVPTPSNLIVWAQHWHTASRVPYNPKFRAFTGSLLVPANTGAFTVGARAYLWVFNPRGLGGEWVLVTASSWLWPDGSDTIGLPLNWSVAGATQVVVGRVNPDSGTHMRSILAGTAQPPLLNYATWAAARFTVVSPASQPDADPDGDGISNRMEFALGLEPTVKNPSSVVPLITAGLVNGVDCLQVTVPRQSDRQVNYAVEASEDLFQWFRGSGSVITLSASLGALSYCDALPLGVREHRFLRVAVETY